MKITTSTGGRGAAQGTMASYLVGGRSAACWRPEHSHFETKIAISGEAAACLSLTRAYPAPGEILRERLNHGRFPSQRERSTNIRGRTRVFLLQRISRCLWAQFEEAEPSHAYPIGPMEPVSPKASESLGSAGLLRSSDHPTGCSHNAHMYYVLLALAPIGKEGAGAD